MDMFLFCRYDNLDGDVLGNFVSSKRPPPKSKPMHVVAGDSPTLASAWERMDKLHSSETSVDTKRAGEKTRPKSGLIVRGMMAGPIASSAQVGLLLFLLLLEWGARTGPTALPGLIRAAPRQPKKWGSVCGTGRSPASVLLPLWSVTRGSSGRLHLLPIPQLTHLVSE